MARSEHRRGRLALGAFIVFALPVGIACNGIIGLSDFEKGQCSGARCVDDSGFPDQIVIDGGGDGPQLDANPDVKGSDPVSWAKWPMPNYLVDGGPTSKPPQSPPLSNDAGGGVVSDLTTKLVWRSTLVPGDFKASEADEQCKKLQDGPWRAAKRIELVSLLDYSNTTPPFIDKTKFADLSYRVWSTSEVRPFTGKADQAYWTVNFDTGFVEPRAGDLTAKVLCLKAVTK